MGGLFKKRGQFHKSLDLVVSGPAQLGEDVHAQVCVTADGKGVRVSSIDGSLVLTEIVVIEEIVDAPMGITAMVENPTVLWRANETFAIDSQLEPTEQKTFEVRMSLPKDKSPTQLGDPEHRWALEVKVHMDAPRPSKSEPYVVDCREMIEVRTG